MKKNNLIRFVQSLVIFPVMSLPFVFTPLHNAEIPAISQNVLAQKFNNAIRAETASETLALNPETVDTEAVIMQARAEKAAAIDSYFEARNMPMAGTGMKMVLEAEKNDLDWRLLPAIAIRESSGGKNACRNNAFGWGSCKIGFNSNEEAIETVARNLGGNNPKTEHHYAGKTTKEILKKYNPPSIVPRYAEQVISIMNAIGAEDTTQTITATT